MQRRSHLPLSRARPAALFATLALLVTAASPTHARPRVTTVVTELAGDTQLDASWAENALADALTAKGYTLIDSSQAQAVRQVNDAGALVRGGALVKVTTTLDADFIIAVVCRLEAINTDLLGPNGHRYDAEIQARLIDVATGQVDGAFTAAGRGKLTISKGEAMRTAGLTAGAALADKLIAHLENKQRTSPPIELSIRGIPNVTAAERVIDGVRHLAGVNAVTVNHQSREMAELAIAAPNKSARELALALDQTHGLGITVFGYSHRTIKADYSPEAATSLQLLRQPFALRGNTKPNTRALTDTLAEMLATSLSNRPYLVVPTQHAVLPADAPPARWADHLKRHRIADGKALVLTGSYSVNKTGSLDISVKLVSARTAATVLSRQATCAQTEVADCVQGLGEALGEALMPALLSKRHLFKNAIPTRLAGGSAPKPLRIAAIDVESVFPTQHAGPIAHVRLVNRGKTPLTDIVVKSDLTGFSTDAVDTDVADLAPGAETRIPVSAVLDVSRLAAHDSTESAVLSLQIRYRADDLTFEESRAVPTLVYDRNTVAWTSPDALAAFVTPRGDAIQDLARQVAAARPKGAADPVSVAASLIVAMHALGLTYQRDPVHPYGAGNLDYVQFPRQTLARRSGDCDDLAVLYASLAEALDLPVVLVTTPDHIFVAAFTGVPAHNIATLHSAADTHLIVHQGMAWLPLETTLLTGDVDAAWQSAARRLARYKDQPEAIRVIDIRAAWADHPAVDLSGAVGAPPGLDATRLSGQVADALTALGARRRATTDTAIAEIDKTLAKTGDDPQHLLKKGFLLVMSGRYVEAEAIFAKVPSASAWQTHALNNAGNVRLLAADPVAASTYYTRAIKLAPDEPRLHINAAVAAHVRADTDAFGAHILDCLLLPGGEDFVIRLNQAGVGQTTRATEGETPPIRAETLRALFERAKRPVPAALMPNTTEGTRASGAGAPTVASLHNLLYWLW